MTIRNLLFITLGVCGLGSCNQYLDLKSVRQTAVPDRLEDLQALLDNRRVINGNSPGMLEGITDNYYVSLADWEARQEEDRNVYTWHPRTNALSPWQLLYQGPIYYANVVLDQLPQLPEVETKDVGRYNAVRGSALFHRAYNFFMLAQLFCPAYSEDRLDALGISLRSTAAVAAPVMRSTVGETYAKIIEDLKTATELLPDQSITPARPSRSAAFGALSRVYLSMADYEKSLFYTEKALEAHTVLVDMNETREGNAPFNQFNEETIFFSYVTTNFLLMNASRVRVDTSLYASYQDHDLRKKHYFRPATGNNTGSHYFNCFQGASNNQMVFTGVMTSELYLTKAECLARMGRYREATESLHFLLRARYPQNTPIESFPTLSAENALSTVLAERRKELVNRGLRWMDLRRLNAGGAEITLRRVLGEETYALPPNDPRWTLLIPDEVVIRSGLEQNPR